MLCRTMEMRRCGPWAVNVQVGMGVLLSVLGWIPMSYSCVMVSRTCRLVSAVVSRGRLQPGTLLARSGLRRSIRGWVWPRRASRTRGLECSMRLHRCRIVACRTDPQARRLRLLGTLRPASARAEATRSVSVGAAAHSSRAWRIMARRVLMLTARSASVHARWMRMLASTICSRIRPSMTPRSYRRISSESAIESYSCGSRRNRSVYCVERNGWYIVVIGSESWRGKGGGSSGSELSGGALFEGTLHCRSGDVGSDATVKEVRDSGGRNLAVSDFGGCTVSEMVPMDEHGVQGMKGVEWMQGSARGRADGVVTSISEAVARPGYTGSTPLNSDP